MRNIGSRPMCRAMPLTRPICISQRTSQKNHLVLGRRFIILVSTVLGLLVSRAECNALSDSESITQESMINNNTRSNQNLLTNDVILDSNDEDSFHLGFSGYLRNSSSTLDFQGKYQNFTDTNVLLANNSTKESPKTIGHRRVKRGVTHLYNMIVCATGCNPLAYKGYGCYCGFLGSGYPMDGIDRCCKMHDWCYDATDCPMFVEYFVPYYWKCYHGYKPICAIDHGEWGSSGSCAQRLCECDRSFSECLRRYRCPRHKAVCTSSPWRLIQNLFMII